MLPGGAALLTATLFVVLSSAAVTRGDPDDGHAGVPSLDAVVSVTPTPVGRALPAGFTGLSFEYPALMQYAGPDPGAPDPLLARLIANLSPGQIPVLRIGGNSTDITWWPEGSRRREAGLAYSLSRRWVAVIRMLARSTRAQLVLGINLKARSIPVATAEADALVGGLGRRTVLALEIGNEPLEYGRIPWYRNRRRRLVWARSAGYSWRQFNGEFASVARQLPPGVGLAGPALGGPGWMSHLSRFLASEPRVHLVTYHSYPLNRCFTRAAAANFATVPHLLSPLASRELAAGLTSYVDVAHRYRRAFRVDELGSVACGGRRGVSDTFASALWAIDTLFAMARAGVDGVNLHTFPGSAYEPFVLHRRAGHWQAFVTPEYYALVLFARAAPAGSRLLAVRAQGNQSVRAWATRAPDGIVRVVLINADARRGHGVEVRAPLPAATATVVSLTAPSITATRGVTLAGARVDASSGRLRGLVPARVHARTPGAFELVLRAGSAAMLELPPA